MDNLKFVVSLFHTNSIIISRRGPVVDLWMEGRKETGCKQSINLMQVEN
jgi:hypothetical protein